MQYSLYVRPNLSKKQESLKEKDPEIKKLWEAVNANDVEGAKDLLINLDINPDRDDFLCFACSRGFKELVSVFLECGASVTRKNSDGFTAMTLAVKEGYIEIVELLYEAGACFSDDVVILATEKVNKELVKLLIKLGANVNGKDEDKRTALMYAVEKENEELIKLLVSSGADINNVDKHGSTVLRYAVEKKNKGLIKLLVSLGADLNINYKSVNTLLINALYDADEAIASFLIKLGADINEVSKDGSSLLMHAARARSCKLVNYLIKHGVNVNHKDSNGDTALMYAIDRVLVRLGYIPSSVEELKTICFCESINYEVTKALVNANADVNIQNNLGKTALMLAVKGKKFEDASILLEAGANVKIKDCKNKTVFSYAANIEDVISRGEFIKLLEKYS